MDAVHTCTHVIKKRICDRKCCHSFHYNNCTGYDHRIMPTFDLKLQILTLVGDSGLGLTDRGGRLDVGTKDNIASVAHAAHNTACMVGSLGNDAVFL